MKIQTAIDKISQEMFDLGIVSDIDKAKYYLEIAAGVGFNYGMAYRSRSKPIMQYDMKGKFIRHFKNSVEAGRMMGIDRNNINRCCNGHLKTAGGFIWKFSTLK